MAYRLDDVIEAADINGFLEQARLLYGVGTGDRGYGQTAIVQPNVNVGDVIMSAHWTNLRGMMSVLAQHQGTSSALLPPQGEFAVGEVVEAHEDDPPTVDAFDVPEVLIAVDAARLTMAPENAALAQAAEFTQSAQWGGLPGDEPYVPSNRRSIIIDIVCTWASEDAARHFFNSGGSLRVQFTHPSGGTTKDQLWRSGLAERVGVIELSARACQQTATAPRGTVSSSTGFYTLTDSFATIYDGMDAIAGFGLGPSGLGYGTYDSGGDPTRANDVIVQARRQGFLGERGGNGSAVILRAILRDEIRGGPGGDDILIAGTRAVVETRRAVTPLVGIAVPSVTSTGWQGDGF